jgi:hypothetical protein
MLTNSNTTWRIVEDSYDFDCLISPFLSQYVLSAKFTASLHLNFHHHWTKTLNLIMKLASSLLIALSFHALVGAAPISPAISGRDGLEAAGYTGAGGTPLRNGDMYLNLLLISLTL